MAIVLRRHVDFLSSLLLLFTLFAFPTSNAMSAEEVSKFCKETPDDVEFCMRYIGRNREIVTARDFNDVFIIAVKQAKLQAADGIKKINKVRKNYNGPIGKKRIQVCEEKYKLASTSFQKAWDAAYKKSFTERLEMTTGSQGGFEALRQCEDEWAKNGPRQKSPLTLYYNNVYKLWAIMRSTISKLSR
ncbi:unnamed protein product [Thlaspi arvense]|uniref:Pectinesterase inhibitor domain-containing protein n=1 Tax=Thlaspi arvense TaxID=13288 RepID=A0AAU9SCH3_THLAR|nr:unnamed protein product [Thlaspi arvense]